MIMKKIFYLYLIFILIFVFSSCTSDRWPAEKPKLTSLSEHIEYELAATIGQNLGLREPSSILERDGRLWISDTGSDRIVVADQHGNLIRTLGRTGNGPVEFIRPTGLATDDAGRLYVVDSGNNRVQVLSPDGAFVKAYAIDKFPFQGSHSYLADIAVQDDRIYVAARTMARSWAKIFVFSDDGAVRSFGKDLVGSIANVGGRVLFASSGEFRNVKEGLSFESGRNYLVEVRPDGLGGVAELPYMYTPGDIQAIGGAIYLLSRAYGTIDRFEENGDYISTSYRFQLPAEEIMGLAAMAPAEDGWWVLNAGRGVVYRLVKKKA